MDTGVQIGYYLKNHMGAPLQKEPRGSDSHGCHPFSILGTEPLASELRGGRALHTSPFVTWARCPSPGVLGTVWGLQGSGPLALRTGGGGREVLEEGEEEWEPSSPDSFEKWGVPCSLRNGGSGHS